MYWFWGSLQHGGVRTLASVGYFLSIMRFATENSVNYPSFLMIDTIAKYIGKTKSKEKDLLETDLAADKIEGMSDAKKYENIYKYLLSLNTLSPNFQIIVVDNDIPESVNDELSQYIRKHFTNDANAIGTEIGFINDAFQTKEVGKLFNGINDNISTDITFDNESDD